MQSSTPLLSVRANTVISAALAVLTVVTLSPLADVLVPALPVATGEVRWRLQVFGTMLAALPQLALLLAAITAVGIFGGNRMAVRASAVAALMLAVIAALLLVPFALDFLDMRRLVPLDRKGNFDMAAMKTGFFGGLFALVLTYMGWRGLQGSVKEKTTERKQGQGLVVGQE
jgi:amino acid transporter